MRLPSRPILILSVVAFLVMLGTSIVSPVLPVYALTFGVSLALVGLLISGFGVARFIIDLPAGVMAERVGSRRFMLFGLAVIAVSSIIAGVAWDYSILLTARIFEGIGSAMYTTTSLTAVSRLSPKESRGANMSLYLGMFLLGTVAGPAIGGVTAEAFGPGAPFLFYGLCAVASVGLVWGSKDIRGGSITAAEPITLPQLGRLLRRYDVISINLATICVFITRQGVLNTVVPLYARYNLGISLTDLGLIVTAGAVGNLGTMLLAGRLTDLYGRKPFFMFSLGLSAIFTIMIPFTTDIVQLTVVLTGMGLALGLSGPIAAWLSDVVSSNELGGAMGLFRTMGDLGFVLAPVTLAALAEGEGQAVEALPFFGAAAVVILIATLLVRTSDPVGEERRRIRVKV